MRLTPWIIKRPNRLELKTTMEFVEKKTGIPMVGAFVGMDADAAVFNWLYDAIIHNQNIK